MPRNDNLGGLRCKFHLIASACTNQLPPYNRRNFGIRGAAATPCISVENRLFRCRGICAVPNELVQAGLNEEPEGVLRHEVHVREEPPELAEAVHLVRSLRF